MPSMRAVSGGRSLLEASTGAADDEAEEDAGRGTGRCLIDEGELRLCAPRQNHRPEPSRYFGTK
uniref:Uncharacterized protein n=1 Tax=Hyaloperonospora arabidopsidis (strain Emoy2) TaxID=559515 RepID=M4BXP1_HYAAE